MKKYSFTDDDLRLAAKAVCASMVDAAEAISDSENEFSGSALEKDAVMRSYEEDAREKQNDN